jgi:hypothetical protein
LKPVIDEWLLEDMKRARKYRRTATKLYNDLKESREYGKQLTVCKQTIELCEQADEGTVQEDIHDGDGRAALNVRGAGIFRQDTG